jgi:hypothetical protein
VFRKVAQEYFKWDALLPNDYYINKKQLPNFEGGDGDAEVDEVN